jgi:hypothetical protein
MSEAGGLAYSGQDPAARQEAGKQEPVKAGGEPSPTKPAPVERKIIYKATLEVVVKDLNAAVQDAEKALGAQKGRVIKSEIRSDTGARRTGTFTLEVPVENFRPLVDALVGLGHPERNSIDSQDVTEEFIDVEIRLKNLRAEHETLNKLLKEKAASVEDVAKLKPLILAVQTDIERWEGRLKYLATKSAFSTVTVTLKEIKDYVPPSAPTFGDRISRTFSASWDALVRFGEGVVLFAVALTPWLPVLLPLGLVGFVSARWAWRTLGVQEDRPAPARRVRERPGDVVLAEDPTSEPPRPPEQGNS